MKKTLIRSGIGFLIGIVIGYIVCLLTGLDRPDVFLPVPDRLLAVTNSVPAALILQGIFSGLYGAVCFAGVSFYEIERWPLALATGAHCALIVIVFIPIAHLLGWETGTADTLIMAGCQLAGFIIIWLIMHAIYKKQVRELNEMQEHYKQSKKS